MPGRQTHGLVTYWSIGDKYGGVYTVHPATCQELGAVSFECQAMAAVCRRTVKALRDLADPARHCAAP
jgi:hypothetical protein